MCARLLDDGPWSMCCAGPRPATRRSVWRWGRRTRTVGMSRSMRRGEPYTPDSLTRMWCKLANAAGVRPIRLHDARHSCGTALHLRGVPLAVIVKWLGHADAATTARIYAHSQDEALRSAGQTLGAVVTSS